MSETTPAPQITDPRYRPFVEVVKALLTQPPDGREQEKTDLRKATPEALARALLPKTPLDSSLRKKREEELQR